MADKRVPRSTEWNQRLHNGVKRIILKRVGRERAFTLHNISLLLSQPYKYEDGKIVHRYTSRQIRMAIEDLIMGDGLPICSEGGVGYWYAANYDEARDSAERELMAKARALWKRARKLRNNARAVYSGQLEMGL